MKSWCFGMLLASLCAMGCGGGGGKKGDASGDQSGTTSATSAAQAVSPAAVPVTAVSPSPAPTTVTEKPDGGVSEQTVQVRPSVRSDGSRPEVHPASDECTNFCKSACQKTIDCQLAAFSDSTDCSAQCKTSVEQYYSDNPSKCTELDQSHNKAISDCSQLQKMMTCSDGPLSQKMEVENVVSYLSTVISGESFCDL